MGRLPSEVVVIGSGPGGLVALSAGAVDKRITKIAAVGTLASFITEEPYEGQRLGVMAPGILRTVGDVASLAALCAPRRVVAAGGVAGNGKLALTNEQLPGTTNERLRSNGRKSWEPRISFSCWRKGTPPRFVEPCFCRGRTPGVANPPAHTLLSSFAKRGAEGRPP